MEEKFQFYTYIRNDYIQKDKNFTKLKNFLHEKIKIIRKEINKKKKEITSKFIQERVDSIRLDRCENPGKFFAKAQPDSVFRSQQVWTVEYEKQSKKSY